MSWRNVKELLGWSRPPYGDEVNEVAPRPLSERETGWVHDILQAVPDWRDADFSDTRVVAEGMNIEGYSIVLRSATHENPKWKSSHDILGQLWIETEDRLTINIQLFQWKGHLQELYVLVLDSKSRNLRLPPAWIEVSREAVNG
jgi:hypothetical protein